MREIPRWTTVLCAAALVGCSTDRAPTATTITPATVSPLFSQGHGPVVQSATGAGHFTVGGELRTFSFTALKYADGTVQGEYELLSRLTGTRIHGDVTCLTVVGNRAWIGGQQEHSNNPALLPGGENGFRVADNGEGANDPPDQMSLMFVGGAPGFAQAYCNAMPPAPPLNPIESGNIQVRS